MVALNVLRYFIAYCNYAILQYILKQMRLFTHYFQLNVVIIGKMFFLTNQNCKSKQLAMVHLYGVAHCFLYIVCQEK